MPKNPFEGIGSRGNIASNTRQIRSMNKAYKRLEADIRGVASAEDAASSSISSAMRSRHLDQVAYEKELKSTDRLLALQANSLKHLDTDRNRYHNAEMKRTSTLLQRYETISRALKEISEDYRDNTTLIGTLSKNIRGGVDEMLRLGDLPHLVGEPIQDVNASLSDMGGTASRTFNAMGDGISQMGSQISTILAYTAALDELDVKIAEIAVAFNDAGEESQKASKAFREAANFSVVGEGHLDTIVNVTKSLRFLEVQGIASGDSAQYLTDRARRSGETFEESTEHMEAFAAQADGLRHELESTNANFDGFIFTVRDDFVRTMMEATRNINSQIVSVENLGAAYIYASKKAADMGFSQQSAQNMAKAWGTTFNEEREDAFTLLAGGILQDQMAPALAELEREFGAFEDQRDEGIKDRFRRAAAEAVGQEFSEEGRVQWDQVIGARQDGGLGNVDTYNLLRGSTAATEAQLTAMMDTVGIGDIENDAVASRLINQSLGLNLDTSDSLGFADMLREGNTAGVAEEIDRIKTEAAELAAAPQKATMDAMSAVLAFQDPINELFNISKFVKSMTLNMSNLVKLVAPIANIFGADFHADNTDELLSDEKKSQRLAGINTLNEVALREEAARAAMEGTEGDERAKAQKALDLVSKERERAMAALNSFAPNDAASNDSGGFLAGLIPDLPAFSDLSDLIPSGDSSDFLTAALRSAAPTIGGFDPGVIASFARNPQQLYQAAQNGPGMGAAPGELEGAGSGQIEVDSSGDSVITMRVKVKNMGEVISHHNTMEAFQNPHASS